MFLVSYRQKDLTWLWLWNIFVFSKTLVYQIFIFIYSLSKYELTAYQKNGEKIVQ